MKQTLALIVAVLLTIIAHTIDYESRYGHHPNVEYDPAKTEVAVAHYRAMVESGQIGSISH